MTKSLSPTVSTRATNEEEQKRLDVANHIKQLRRLGVQVTVTRDAASWRPAITAKVHDARTVMLSDMGLVSRPILESLVKESSQEITSRLIAADFIRFNPELRKSGTYELTKRGEEIAEQPRTQIKFHAMCTIKALDLTLRD